MERDLAPVSHPTSLSKRKHRAEENIFANHSLRFSHAAMPSSFGAKPMAPALAPPESFR